MKKQITLRIDGDILDWFRSGGDGYQSRINDALRIQMGRSMDKSDIDINTESIRRCRESVGVPVYVKPKPKKPSKVIAEVRDEFFKPRPKK